LSCEQRAFSSSSLSPCQSLQDKKADLDRPSLHRKIPFPAPTSETGSMTGGGSSVCARLPPPSSLRKPQVFRATPNRAFLRGFPATHFRDFGLCGRSSILMAILGALSPHPKIPFPAAVAEHELGPHCTRNSDFRAVVIRDFGTRRCGYSGLSPAPPSSHR
jgi:hypothetical protein